MGQRRAKESVGLFLGTESIKAKNWEETREKACAQLSTWKWLLPQMSYRGRVLLPTTWLPQLSGTLVALTPTTGLTDDIQKNIVDFF